MAFNGSGTFLINTAGQPVVSGTVISSTAFNALTADLATGLSTAITKDGQTTVTANIPMSTYKFTGLGVGSAAGDSANLSQVQSTVTKLLTSVSGTDTITAVGAPVVAAYAAGQMFYFVATGDNTGAVTLNIDSLGAKAVTRDGSVALAAGDIKSGEVVVVVYDGTRFQVVSQLNSAGNATFANVSITSALNVGGVATFTANPVLSGGTANGVLYLNGSKVATSGSALTFDGTNLAVGASPGFYGAQVATAGSISITGGNLLKLWNTGGTGVGGISSPGTDTIAFGLGASFTEGMRLTTTGLGIGTSSPNGRLDVASGNLFITQDFELNWHSAGTKRSQIIGDSSNNLKFSNRVGGVLTNTMTLDGSGNLGLGVSPSAWETANSVRALQLNGGNVSSFSNAYIWVGQNWYRDSAGAERYVNTAAATKYQQAFGAHQWYTAPSGTAGNAITFTQAMTLDASGNLLVGNTTQLLFTNKELNVNAASGSAGFALATGGTARLYMTGSSSDGNITTKGAIPLLFGTNETERARITSGGAFLVGTTSPFSGNANTFNSVGVTGSDWALVGSHTASNLNVRCILASAPNYSGNDGYFFIGNRSTGDRIYIRTSGDIENTNGTYGTISDQRLKQDIVDAPSQWNDLKAVRFRKYRLKDDVQADSNAPALLGVIAQELEQVCPGLVQGDELKTVKSSILLMKAAVALQEAMARIEQLEAKFAALETK